ncbi:WD repeat-containing protein mip1 [Zancudomyces culisetae]|uniref:WD repeat-containing protein mip1 n=1 Tax=Zancudomyces culisetae TaxID=1213189 RepID=A0A1R1PYI2_ZANCU|nr:WD repeat-containing protein mip1 [Zancudomyces culisetae]|eukprot:OMH85995.1 WD repeat-containing protein mip1 [Zancudomyces culisetae]
MELANFQIGEWKQKEKYKIGIGVITVCLNVGTEPPDLIKPKDACVLEAGIDPNEEPELVEDNVAAKGEDSKNGRSAVEMRYRTSLEKIGLRLLDMYQEISRTNKLKLALDPPVEDYKKLIMALRNGYKEERMLIHYNGHGVPKPTAGGDVWVFNRSFSQYIPVSGQELASWVNGPGFYVWEVKEMEKRGDGDRSKNKDEEREKGVVNWSSVYISSAYFSNQLNAFELWLHHAQSVVSTHLTASSRIEGIDGRRVGVGVGAKAGSTPGGVRGDETKIRSLSLEPPAGLEPPIELPALKKLDYVSTAASFVLSIFCKGGNGNKESQYLAYADHVLVYFYGHLQREDNGSEELWQLKMWTMYAMAAMWKEYPQAQLTAMKYNPNDGEEKEKEKERMRSGDRRGENVRGSSMRQGIRQGEENNELQRERGRDTSSREYMQSSRQNISEDTSKSLVDLLVMMTMHQNTHVRASAIYTLGTLIEGVGAIEEAAGREIKHLVKEKVYLAIANGCLDINSMVRREALNVIGGVLVHDNIEELVAIVDRENSKGERMGRKQNDLLQMVYKSLIVMTNDDNVDIKLVAQQVLDSIMVLCGVYKTNQKEVVEKWTESIKKIIRHKYCVSYIVDWEGAKYCDFDLQVSSTNSAGTSSESSSGSTTNIRVSKNYNTIPMNSSRSRESINIGGDKESSANASTNTSDSTETDISGSASVSTRDRNERENASPRLFGNIEKTKWKVLKYNINVPREISAMEFMITNSAGTNAKDMLIYNNTKLIGADTRNNLLVYDYNNTYGAESRVVKQFGEYRHSGDRIKYIKQIRPSKYLIVGKHGTANVINLLDNYDDHSTGSNRGAASGKNFSKHTTSSTDGSDQLKVLKRFQIYPANPITSTAYSSHDEVIMSENDGIGGGFSSDAITVNKVIMGFRGNNNIKIIDLNHEKVISCVNKPEFLNDQRLNCITSNCQTVSTTAGSSLSLSSSVAPYSSCFTPWLLATGDSFGMVRVYDTRIHTTNNCMVTSFNTNYDNEHEQGSNHRHSYGYGYGYGHGYGYGKCDGVVGIKILDSFNEILTCSGNGGQIKLFDIRNNSSKRPIFEFGSVESNPKHNANANANTYAHSNMHANSIGSKNFPDFSGMKWLSNPNGDVLVAWSRNVINIYNPKGTCLSSISTSTAAGASASASASAGIGSHNNSNNSDYLYDDGGVNSNGTSCNSGFGLVQCHPYLPLVSFTNSSSINFIVPNI